MCNMRRRTIGPAIALVSMLMLLAGHGSTVLAQPSILVGSRAPEIKAVGVRNESVQVPARGGITVLVFWNSKYRLSLDALAAMQGIWEAYGARGVVCVGLNDLGEEDRAVEQLAERMNIGFVLVSGRAASSAAVAYRLRGVPAVFVVDRSGVIVYVREGWDKKAESEIREIISKAL